MHAEPISRDLHQARVLPIYLHFSLPRGPSSGVYNSKQVSSVTMAVILLLQTYVCLPHVLTIKISKCEEEAYGQSLDS